MKNSIVFALLIVLSGNTFAGLSNYSDVLIDIAGGTVQGSMIGARNSADPDAFIACDVTSTTPEPNTEIFGMFCMAYTTANGFAFCWSNSSLYAESASSVSATSQITFKWKPYRGQSGGQCTYVDVNNASFLIE